jgi:hypothetical protein
MAKARTMAYVQPIAAPNDAGPKPAAISPAAVGKAKPKEAPAMQLAINNPW